MFSEIFYMFVRRACLKDVFMMSLKRLLACCLDN